MRKISREIKMKMKVPYPNSEGFIEFDVMDKQAFLKRLKKRKEK